MPGRFAGATFNFARPWSIQLGRDLNQLLKRLGDSANVLQGAPGTPEDVELDGPAAVGLGPAPALDDHVHALDAASPSNPTGASASEGTSSSVLRADATIAQGIVTTKGDLLSFSTNPDRLPVGSDDEIIVADSGEVIARSSSRSSRSTPSSGP